MIERRRVESRISLVFRSGTQCRTLAYLLLSLLFMMSTRILFTLSTLFLSITAAACSAPSLPPDLASPDDSSEEGEEGGEEREKPSSSSPSSSSEVRIDLGTVAAGTEVSFDIPAGTIGFTIIADARAAGQDDFIGIEELRDPSREAFVTDFRDTKNADSRVLAGSSGAGVGVLVFPLIGDRAAQVRTGKWTTKLGGSTRVANAPKGTVSKWSGQVHGVVILQKTSDATFKGGKLDLDLYVPDGLRVFGSSGASHTVNATSAPSDPDLKDRIDRTFGLYQRLYGIGRGDVRWHRVASSVAAIAGQGELDAANVLADAPQARPAGQVVFTNRLEPDGEGEGEISGISSCLPGAIGIPGTKCSAVVVSLRGSLAWEDAATIVHELGHFIGLEHTTEFGGGFDTLADTPECASTGKSDLTRCPDFDNLMFPTTSLSSQERTVTVSAVQRRIMQASPLYRSM